MKSLIFILLFFIAGNVFSQEVPKNIEIKGIPGILEWVIEPDSFNIHNGTVSISAGPGTNMFYAPHGNFNVSNMPKLLFKPDDNFTFSAKAFTKHKTRWEAAMLVVYINESYWAKFCFENESLSKNRMVTVVNNEISDDAYSDYVVGDSVYMMIKKEGKQITFSYSGNGKNWVDIRYFRLNSDDTIKIGFASQSPIGNGLTSIFSNINYINDKQK
jgi:regulation of enolase protein 1 (concanavalin A-like superfamily)